MSDDDLLAMSDDELERRIMLLLKQNCDKCGMPYPPKLIAYITNHPDIFSERRS